MASDPISRHGAQASVFSSGAVFRYVVLACLFTAAVFLQVGSTRAILHRVPVDIPMFSPAPASAALEYVDSQAHRPTRDADFLSQGENDPARLEAVSYTHLRAHETDSYLVCRLLLEKKKK